jgi:maleamate amidohydrolase
MKAWDRFLTERDRRVFAGSGFGQREGLGVRPAILVVDMTYNFVGDRREPIEESIERWPMSCGEEAWTAAAHIATLLTHARERRIPVVYTRRQDQRPDRWDLGRLADKSSRGRARSTFDGGQGNEIVPALAPQPQDIVLPKPKPSAFFGTPLVPYLVDLGVDTLLVCGSTTSGCVRATVVDAYSNNYYVGVVSECTFDRGEAAHAVSLFDMNEKYADVIELAAAIEYLKSIPAGSLNERMPKARDSSVALTAR